MRRGINQLEMVLAFLIFIGAIAGSVFFLQTFRAQTEQFSQAEVWVDSLQKAMEDEVIVTSFLLNRTSIGTLTTLTFNISNPSLPTVLVNASNALIPSGHAKTHLSFNLNKTSTNKGFIIQSRSLIEQEGSSSNSPIPGTYLLSAPTTRQIVTETRIRTLQEQLTTSQAATLTSLGLPPSLTIRLAFSAPGVSIASTLAPPQDREVRTITRRVELMTKEGTFIFGTLQIALW